MKTTSCIILNYNDWETTLNLVRELTGMRGLDHLVVVDNHSGDDSWERLQVLKDEEQISLLRTRKNLGYGRGNQAGIDYAVSRLRSDYIVVANPDIHITARTLEQVRRALDGAPRGAAASAMVKSPQGRPLFSYWMFLPLWKELLDAEPVCRRLFRPLLDRPLSRLEPAGSPGSFLVDAVPGSFFMLRTDRFAPWQLKELFDPQVFLYCEEKILGQKLRSWGLQTVLAANTSYIHAHSVSIDKSFRKIVDKQRLLHKSRLYYYQHYLHPGRFGMLAARLWLGAVLAEVWFLTRICRLSW